MPTLRTFLILIVLAGSSVLPAQRARAQAEGSPEALQVASELMAVLSKDMMAQMSSQMIAQIWPSIEQRLRAERPSIDAATLADLRGEFERIQLDFLTDAMKTAPAIYARYFTAAELRDMLAFYRTPTGAKALKLLPQVTAEFFAGLMPRLQTIEKDTTASFERIMRQRGYIK